MYAVQSQRSFFSEIISSISDMKFSRDGRFILARDFMSLKLWDLKMENRPLAIFPVHEGLRSKVSPFLKQRPTHLYAQINMSISLSKFVVPFFALRHPH